MFQARGGENTLDTVNDEVLFKDWITKQLIAQLIHLQLLPFVS